PHGADGLFGGGGVGGALPQRAAVGDPALVQVVRRDGDGNDVAGENADEVLTNLARDVSDDLVPILQTDLELRVGQVGRHLALYQDRFFFCHHFSLCKTRTLYPTPV